MLLQAIERYQRAIPSSCRRINSHAGPLEGRRRAAKRHMTGLMQTSHAYPPIWQFDVGPSMLQWEAPTTQAHRKQKREKASVSGLFNSLVGWLENSGAAETPQATALDQNRNMATMSAEALAVTPDAELESTAEPILYDRASSPHLPEEIVKLRLSILDADIGDTHSLLRLAKTCRRAIRQRIERGDMSVEALLASLEPLDASSTDRIKSDHTANKMAAMIRRGILSAMEDAQKQVPSRVAQILWIAFFDRICAANGDNLDLQTFWRLMQTWPASLRHKITAEQIRNFTYSFITAQASRSNAFSHWSSRAARLSKALLVLSKTQREALDESIKTFLLQQDWVTDKSRRLRFSWLVVKAYDSDVAAQDFAQMYHGCVGSEVRLNSMQLWQLMVARLSATGTFDTDVRKELMKASYNFMSERWTALASAIISSPNKESGLQELCAALTEIGEFSTLVRALTSHPLTAHRKEIIQAIATACENHKQALQLHDSIAIKQPPSARRSPVLGLPVWNKYIEQMIKDPNLDPIRVWQVLRFTSRTRPSSNNAHNNSTAGSNEDIQTKVQLLDQMGQWFMEATHLNDRQILRNVQRCVTCQRALSNGVSSRTLANVTEVVTRDMEKGQMGRKTRLEWLVGMVAQHQGHEEAKNAASALKGWRWTIDRARKGSL